jgi:lysophospholipase L1-like esterase
MDNKFVFIGHSIIAGYPLMPDQCFVSRLREKTGHEIINKGANGETTADITRRFTNDVISILPDTVFIMSGTNDFIYDETSVTEVYDGLIKMAMAASACGIKPVFLTSPPVDSAKASRCWMSGIDYNYINTQLEELANMLSSSSYETIDFNKEYSQFGEFIDGLHPTAAGHQFMADILFEYINSKGALE